MVLRCLSRSGIGEGGGGGGTGRCGVPSLLGALPEAKLSMAFLSSSKVGSVSIFLWLAFHRIKGRGRHNALSAVEVGVVFHASLQLMSFIRDNFPGSGLVQGRVNSTGLQVTCSKSIRPDLTPTGTHTDKQTRTRARARARTHSHAH